MTNRRNGIAEGLKRFFALAIALHASAALHAAEPGRFIMTVKLPSGQTAVVAEGDFEARSTGSFSMRLYESAQPGDETTFFTAGLILSRNGGIEKVALADIDSDRKPEIVVVVRSLGTGGYLSAHAVAFSKKTWSCVLPWRVCLQRQPHSGPSEITEI
jgi:hypothetical protein